MASSDLTPPVIGKPKRVLACVSCQQRKLKCDRVFPCAKCIQAGIQCAPATPKQRRRMPADLRELSERLKHCEELLRQNNIQIDDQGSPEPVLQHSLLYRDSEEGCSLISAEGGSPNLGQPLNLIETIGKVMGSSSETDPKGDDLGATTVRYKVQLRPFKRPWTSACKSEGLLLFGSGEAGVSLTSSHPGQAQIFRLWQIYVDSVEPMLKVVHVPTLQARILNAVSDMANMDAKTEALMFSFYCASLMAMSEKDCQMFFGSAKTELLTSYHAACRQALVNSMALRADHVDSLTASFLYLVSLKPQVHPRSLASVLATLIRIARRIGIDNESKNAKYGALEAEMRRRLWWSLVIFDHRMCELSDHSTTTLIPTWDCRTPHNWNDFELRAEAKFVPSTSGNHSPSEAIYAVVRSELADIVRHSDFHLDFVNPYLKGSIRAPRQLLRLRNLAAFEEHIENTYLRYCSLEHPVHYMTIWTTRAYLGRTKLLAHYAEQSMQSQSQTDSEQEDILRISLDMVECDSQLRMSPLTVPFRWRIDWYVPGLAYNHILNSLWKRPTQPLAERAWGAMNANWKARLSHEPTPAEQNSVLAFSRLVLKTWDIREALPREHYPVLEPPEIVSDMKQRFGNAEHLDPTDATDMSRIISDETFQMFGHMDASGYAADFGYLDLFDRALCDMDMAQF